MPLRLPSWLRFLLVVVAIDAALISLFVVLKAERIPERAPITHVRAGTFPTLEAALAEVAHPTGLPAATLPWIGCDNDCGDAYLVVHADTDAPIDPERDYAVYVQFFNESARVFVDGHPYGPDWLTPPAPLRRHWPLLASLPGSLLSGKPTKLSVVLRAADASGHVLAPFWFAYESELRPHYVIARWMGALGHQVAALLLTATVLLALAMLATARRDAFYGWFALIATGGLMMLSNSIWPRLPLPTGLIVWLYFVGAFACVCFAPRFADAVMQEASPRFSRLIAACYPVAVSGAAVLWWIPGPSYIDRNVWPAIVLRLLAAVVAPYLLWRCLRYAASHRDDRFAPWVIGWLVGATLCGGYDAALSSNLFGLWEVSTAAFGCFFLAVAFVFEIARRVDSNERRMRHSVRELEAAVAAREAELRESFARLSELAREQTLTTERRRLMQDMHDGVAGRLAGLLGRPAARDLDAPALLATVRESLTDLRLIIDSLNQFDDDLVLAIAGLRPRLEAQLAQAGIALAWRIDPALRLAGFGPEAVLNVYRIVQEAVNNIGRHSGASHAELELACRDGRVELAVADDGRGLGDAVAGLGTRSMASRARQLGAELTRRDRVGGGTEVRLTFPAARAVPPPAD